MFVVMLSCAGSVFFFVKSKRGMMLGAFVSGVGFRFGAIGGAAFFDLGGLVVGKLGNFGECDSSASSFPFFCVFFLDFFDFLDFFLFFKNRTAGESGNLRRLPALLPAWLPQGRSRAPRSDRRLDRRFQRSAVPAETLRGAADYFRARKACCRRPRQYFRPRIPGRLRIQRRHRRAANEEVHR